MLPATMKSRLFNFFVVAICISLCSGADAVEDVSNQLATPPVALSSNQTTGTDAVDDLSDQLAATPTVAVPSVVPVPSPSSSPSRLPSLSPTTTPAETPSSPPSSSPSVTSVPTQTPTSAPSSSPSVTSAPSETLSTIPSAVPTVSSAPSAPPTSAPSPSPTVSAAPTSFPSVNLEGLTIRKVVFNAVKDTYIQMGSNKTFGNATSLRVDGDPQIVTLLKFDISSMNGGTDEEPLSVHGATLKLNALTGSEFGGSVSVYYNLDFDEEGANEDSDGNWDGLTETYHVGQFGKIEGDKAYTLDIIGAFRKKPLPQTFSIRIASDSGDGVDYSSREGSKAPRVIFDIAYDTQTQSKLADTFGTDSPTQAPTITKTWEDNPVPSNPPSRYFNYDPTSEFGPKLWKNGRGTNDLTIWQNLRTDRTTMKCKNGTRQSPRDVCRDTKSYCHEKHEIRRGTKGDYGFISGKVPTPIAEIKPHKLSLRFPEKSSEYVVDDKNPREYPQVPRADFSMNGYNSGEQPLIFLDFKTMSEHKICGRQYDVELQYFYLHQYGNLEAVAILGEVDEDLTRRNPTFQAMLNYFQKQANRDKNACKEKQRRARALFRASKGSGTTDMSNLRDEPNFMEEQTETTLPFESDDELGEPEPSKGDLYHNIMTRFLNIVDQRDLRSEHAVDFYHKVDIWRTEWFIGYEGSTTFPPCSEKVNWRVLDTIFKITKSQLRQLRNIQFEHIDPNTCKLDSVHHNESNARPIEKYKGGRYYRCTHRHYPNDLEREESGIREGYSDHNMWYGSEDQPLAKPAAGLGLGLGL